MTQDELDKLFDIWQLNMINCCRFELQFLPIEGSTMLVLLPDGVYLRDFAKMLRADENCYTFVIENTQMLCPGKRLLAYTRSLRLFGPRARNACLERKNLFETFDM